MTGVSSVDVTSGNRTLVGLPGPADTGTGGVRRSARGMGTRGGRGGNGRGRRNGRRVGRAIVRRAIISEADNLGTSNNESIEGIGPDVGPFESIVHSREAGEIAGGWFVSASILYIDLAAEGISLNH